MKKQMNLSPSGKWYEWNRFFELVFLVCMAFNFVPATGQKSAKPMLYKVISHQKTLLRRLTE